MGRYCQARILGRRLWGDFFDISLFRSGTIIVCEFYSLWKISYWTEIKIILLGIISIVCFSKMSTNLDTHEPYDEETGWLLLSGKQNSDWQRSRFIEDCTTLTSRRRSHVPSGPFFQAKNILNFSIMAKGSSGGVRRTPLVRRRCTSIMEVILVFSWDS